MGFTGHETGPGVAASAGFAPTCGRSIADVPIAKPFWRPISTLMVRPLLSTLAILLSLTATAVPQDTADSVWTRLLDQDARVSFTSRTELAALTALEGGGLDQDSRAAALFALGASGSTRARALLEESLNDGPVRERCAAVLALGEMGIGVRTLLEGLREDSDPLVSECALLALMRTGRWAAAEYVEAVAESGDEARSQVAEKLLLFATNAPASESTAASELLLELRWDAARRFGLVDHRAWEVVQLERLAQDPEFLKGFILTAVAETYRPGIKDHFRSLVEAERKGLGAVSDTTICAALRAMPKEVSLLVESGLWNPRWDVLLQEIRDSELEGSTRGLLNVAKEIPSMRYRAVSLLVRSGNTEVLEPVLDELESGELGPMQLVWCCEALGDSGSQAAIPALDLLSQHSIENVAAAANIQLARLGDERAAVEVKGFLADTDSYMHRQVVGWVAAHAESPILASLLSDALSDMKGARALEANIALSLEGDSAARGRLREILISGLPPGELGASAVRALEASGSIEDLAYLKHQFPHERDRVVNEALALAMFRARDSRVLPLIRAGVWDSEEFDQSVLASALFIEIAGLRALVDEARYEPMLDAHSDHARYRAPKYPRRVGYALGLWGGAQALEELYSEVSDVREDVRHGAVLGALASRTH